MDWKLVATTFLAVFLAELGDKTQLATMAFAGGGSSRRAVFVGSALALVLSSALAVLVGGALAKSVPPALIRRAAGVLFLVIGVFFLLQSPQEA